MYYLSYYLSSLQQNFTPSIIPVAHNKEKNFMYTTKHFLKILFQNPTTQTWKNISASPSHTSWEFI